MAVFPFFAIAITAFTVRYITKTWLAPGSFFSICWAFFLIVPVVFASEYKTDILGLWFISIFTMALVSGSLIAYSPFIYTKKKYKKTLFLENYNAIYSIFLLFTIISFIGLVFLLRFASNNYIPDYYNTNWLTIPNFIAADRYGNDINYPLLIKYSLYFIYPANLMGGLLYGYGRIPNKLKVLLFIPLIEAIGLGVVEGARTSILLGSILFISSYLSMYIFEGQLNKQRKTYLKILSIFAIISILFIFLFVFIQWLRQGMDPIVIDLLIDRIRAYFFGYLAAFTKWITSTQELNIINGLITFAGPFNLFGIMERPLGFYESINIGNGISTNIFTAFRGLVTDFTIPGSIIIGFVIGFISQYIFQTESKMRLLNTLPISMFYAFTLYSPLISIFHYNSILFSWFIVSIPLIIFCKYESVVNNS